MKRPIILIVLLATLPVLMALTASPVDSTSVDNEITTSQSEASNSSASATITITMTGVYNQ